MIHQPLGGAEGQATDIKIASDRIINLKDKLNKILVKNTGKSLSKIVKDTERDNYLNADEALKYGIVDKIIKK
jgi:ATP-dependent Clp protease protease subunit